MYLGESREESCITDRYSHIRIVDILLRDISGIIVRVVVK